ncbi:alanyl-tRNA synthetase [Tieghemostelium lacteum]|uniref:Alanine--tRNA ligase n=1 Tax=Tieghemostelium lacteum TaxID=361077 RepID=A0A151Z2V6_TIELA|nr:alanyl-tRNA synthetase [Tieghemostelium lacteum]|eukprot:KYQ88257.1 alanyl-tRNA synthetase [Tieghemostelium lacteum]
MDCNKVRQTFIDFFKDKCNHTFVPSSSCIPHEDPTLLFANAGMNQFKPIFLGQVNPKSEQAKLERAVNSQKCIRAGGKHNDLDDVGKDTYHHTFFEMLGNWSFSNYFKKEAITWAWELLTEVYKLDKERLYVTYFRGDPSKNLEEDTEAKNLWLQFLPAERVLPFGMKENFWEMGDQGPCGPCSEIHYDKIPGRNGAPFVNADDPTLIEIWNLVFIQFNREADKSLRPLPNKHVDTGMGLERLTSIIQKVPTNYDTDIFAPIFKAIQEVTGYPHAYGGKVGKDDPDQVDMAYRVIGDHIRTLTFSISDGAVPDVDGRGQVLRRILRRAVRYGKQKLNAPSGFFTKLVDVVIDNFGGFYPELRRKPDHIKFVLQREEEIFNKTLERGIIEFEKIVKNLNGSTVIPGQSAHYLSSRYGFPIDLTTLMAAEKSLTVDTAECERIAEKEAEYNRQRQKQKKSSMVLGAEAVSILNGKKIPHTDDSHKYEQKEIKSTVRAIWNNSTFLESITKKDNEKDLIGLVLEATNFYPEQGGQIFDIGKISLEGNDKTAFEVTDCKEFGGFVIHIGYISYECEKISVGDSVDLTVDYTRRAPIMSNHTSTHMLNYAIKSVLGEFIEQRGSLVDESRLRFDFSHNKQVTVQELAKIEEIVNNLIRQQLTVYAKEVPLEGAKKINGLRAVFGEKYPDPVRVISIGKDIDEILKNPENPEWHKYSIEFCGGTHLTNTKQAEAFTIVTEEGVAAGIRRIVAVTGTDANDVYERNQSMTKKFNDALTINNGTDLNSEIKTLKESLTSNIISTTTKDQLNQTLNNLEQLSKKFAKDLVLNQTKESDSFVESLTKTLESKPQYLVEKVNLASNTTLITETIKKIQAISPLTSVMLLSPDEEKSKVTILTNVSKSELAQKGLKANEWAKVVVELLGGKGGGRPDVAQAVGSKLELLDQALQLGKSYVENISKQ